MKKYILFVIVLICIALLWVLRDRLFSVPKVSKDKTVIVVTTQQLETTAAKVGGEFVSTQSLFANSAAPQAPSEKQLDAVRAADVFIYNGDASSAWVDAIAPELSKKGIVVIKFKPALLVAQPEKELNRTLADRLARVLEVLDVAHANAFAHNAQSYIATQQ